MSYILSALKKAEQQRGQNQGSTPAVIPVPTVSEMPGRPRMVPVAIWLVAAIVIVGVFISFFYETDITSQSRVYDRSPLSETMPVIEQPVPRQIADPGVVNPSSATEQAPASPPVLNITGYIFLENNPDASKIFIDGVVYRRGSSPDPGVTILSFRADAVVIDYRGSRHQVQIP